MPTSLYCIPFAGSGATFYRGWTSPSAELTIEPVQLPGRDELLGNPHAGSVDEIVDFAMEQVARTRNSDAPTALLGHSFGAIVAFELARRLTDAGRAPVHLFVSGSADPTRSVRRNSAVLDDDEFVARVEELAGYRHPALTEPELRNILLPGLRADVALHESYRATDPTPLPLPITAVRGVDDHTLTAADCAGWGKVTSVGCEVIHLPGGHMYLAHDHGPLLAVVCAAVSSRRLAKDWAASRFPDS